MTCSVEGDEWTSFVKILFFQDKELNKEGTRKKFFMARQEGKSGTTRN